jgi:phosphatidylserine decarboxylase
VSSIRLHFADLHLHHDYAGPQTVVCNAPLKRGEEMGWFEHGSTIIVFVPAGLELAANIATGARLKAGEPLFKIV